MVETFDDLQFTKFLDGVSATVTYGDYELSVVKHSSSYGGRNGMYEIAVFKGQDMVEMPGITQEGDTVKGFLNEEEVTGIMKKMMAVGGPQ
tara:strand:+ start:249 stop:521 length:273 start_codon:yes stop_codon:yes gene_type:complete